MIVLTLKLIMYGFTIAGTAFYALSIIAGFRFFQRRKQNEQSDLEPVSIMIPLRGADFRAYQNYSRFCEQDYPEYQLVFGVSDAGDSSIPIVRKLIADFPKVDIELVVCPNVVGQNLKVSNLNNMLRSVKYERIIVVDSDIRVGRDYLRSVTAPLSNPEVGLVTCLYRAAEAGDFAARFEAVGITGEFVAGVLMAWMLEGVKFALGSTIATTRSNLESIGGFAAVADYLADDFMLGSLIASRGLEVRLSHHIVETAMYPAGFRGMIRHQMRWARSTRISRPMGYLGLILTYGTALALLTVAADRASSLSLALLGSTLFVRLTMAWLIGVYWMRDEILRRNFWLVPLRDLLSFAIWCFSWVGNRVEWRGRMFEVYRGGKMAEVSKARSFVGQVNSAGTK
jgi:ceramide glucosyltransferase